MHKVKAPLDTNGHLRIDLASERVIRALRKKHCSRWPLRRNTGMLRGSSKTGAVRSICVTSTKCIVWRRWYGPDRNRYLGFKPYWMERNGTANTYILWFLGNG